MCEKMEHPPGVFPDQARPHLAPNYPPIGLLHLLHKEEKKVLKRRTRVQALKRDTAQTELYPALLLAQFISVMPISGISQPEPHRLRFKWITGKIFYCLAMIFFEIFFATLTIMNYVRNGISARSFGDVLFYGGSIFASSMFLLMARKWKDFITHWVVLQNNMSDFEKYSVRKTITTVTVALALSSAFEHCLSISETFFNFPADEDNRMQKFFVARHRSVFEVFSYSLPLGLLVQVCNFIITMIWNFVDIFLTAVSLALSKMFKQFSKDLQLTADSVTKETAVTYWRRRREIYCRLSLLVKSVDRMLSFLVLYSFGANLYYICVQLLNSIDKTSLTRLVYFSGSFGHLICRTCAVCFSASSIYENSREPLVTIFSVPSEFYNIEVQRLQTQISTEILALTGCNFFTVTRTLMLTVAGTIVTYEIVLVQFNGMSPGSGETTGSTSGCEGEVSTTPFE